jgi:DNA-binding MarR family transcriptional regulator
LQSRLDTVAAAHGLSHKGDLDVLTALRRSGTPYELSPSRLARAVQLTTGGMTVRLDRLEERGLVSRRPDPTDRRGVLVRLSDEGRRVVDEALNDVLSEDINILLPFSADQRRELAGLLEHLLVSLGDRREERVDASR